MQIASCPDCGYPITLSDLESDQHKLIQAAGALVAAANVMAVFLELPQYVMARDGFEERMKEITDQLQTYAEEFIAWGDGYDT